MAELAWGRGLLVKAPPKPVYLSRLRLPVIVYSVISGSVLSQAPGGGAHEPANLGEHMARGCGAW